MQQAQFALEKFRAAYFLHPGSAGSTRVGIAFAALSTLACILCAAL